MDKYFKDAISFLSDIDRKSLNENIIYQINKMSAENFNVTQEEIYKHLNNLYEKTRILEDVKNHVVSQTKKSITESLDLCQTLLKEIEASRDSIKETTYRTIPVYLVPTEQSLDRDGVMLPQAIIYNREVLSKSTERRSLPYKTEVKTYKTPYKVTENALEKKEPYRSYYILEQPLNNGVIEDMSFIFQQPFGVNKLSFKPAATELFNVKLHNKKDTINLTDLYYKEPIEAEKASIKLKVVDHTERIFLCDQSRLSPDALEKLNQAIYKEYIGEEKLTQKELEDLLGITQLKKDYQDYLAKVEDWRRRRKRVAQINRKNGYKDSVPKHDIIKLPEELGVDEKDMNGDTTNQTIGTEDILPVRPVIEKDNDKERIVYMYDQVDRIFPTAERYRYDYLNPDHDRYYEKLMSQINDKPYYEKPRHTINDKFYEKPNYVEDKYYNKKLNGDINE